MKFMNRVIVACCILLCTSVWQINAQDYPFRRADLPVEERVEDLVRMGGAKEAMKAEGHIIQDYQFLYPIPKTELERINNTELLWQNTGY